MTVDNPLSTPNPDPTARSLDALYREVASVREVFDTRLDSAKEREATGFANVEHQFEMLNRERTGNFEALRERFDDRVARLGDVHAERFASIATQFKERDTRSERESRDNKVAVDAAFAAQKEAAAAENKSNREAIGKSEAATSEKIDKLNELFTTTINAIRQQVDDLKEQRSDDNRALRQSIADAAALANGIAQQKVGAGEQRQEHTDNRLAIYGTVSLIVGLIGAVVLVVGFVIAEAARTP